MPDREPETVKKWFADHPRVELVSRDRWSDYIQTAAEGAPNARQVADRWHLLKNLREALERLFERESGAIEAALKPPEPAPDPLVVEPEAPTVEGRPAAETPSSPPPGDPAAASPRQAKRRRRVERLERVDELKRQGHSVRGIAHELDLTRKAVRRYLRRTTCPDWRPGQATRSGMDRYREEIDRRIAEGCTNAAELHRDLAARGCRLSYASTRRYVTKRLVAAGKPRARVNAAKAPTPPLPSAKKLSFDWVRRREDREDERQARLDAIRGRSAELSAVLGLVDEFAALIRNHSEGTLIAWLASAEASPCL